MLKYAVNLYGPIHTNTIGPSLKADDMRLLAFLLQVQIVTMTRNCNIDRVSAGDMTRDVFVEQVQANTRNSCFYLANSLGMVLGRDRRGTCKGRARADCILHGAAQPAPFGGACGGVVAAADDK